MQSCELFGGHPVAFAVQILASVFQNGHILKGIEDLKLPRKEKRLANFLSPEIIPECHHSLDSSENHISFLVISESRVQLLRGSRNLISALNGASLPSS